MLLRYHNGVLTEGITRGDGEIGESVYENLLVIPAIPKIIPEKLPYLEVRGEVYMSLLHLKRLIVSKWKRVERYIRRRGILQQAP